MELARKKAGEKGILISFFNMAFVKDKSSRKNVPIGGEISGSAWLEWRLWARNPTF